LQTAALLKKETIFSTWKARRHSIVNVVALIIVSVSISFTHIGSLVQVASAGPLEERNFHVACSSFVRGVSASLTGDRNLEHGVSPLLSYHHIGEEGLSGRWASLKQGIALFATLQSRHWKSFAARAFDDCNLLGYR
jgi:hypothetical protein